jgi:hypothetical protein
MLKCFSDVLVLNDIINQTATDGSTPEGHSILPAIEIRHNSVQSAGSATVSATAAALARARKESRKISMMLDEDEHEGPRLKERLTVAGYQFIDIFCLWDCCAAYVKLSEVLG